MIACNECKGTNISEQLWVRTNEPKYVKKGRATDEYKPSTYIDTYYPIDFDLLDKYDSESMYYCHDCHDEAFVHDNEDKESHHE